MDVLWVKIESWHAIGPDTIVEYRTLCGIATPPDSETSDLLPADKSCENCLRILARANDEEPVPA